MNPTLVNTIQILFALFCILFGIDKFVEFLPTCSLLNYLPKSAMMVTGVLEILIGILLLLKKQTLLVLRLATAIMLGGFLLHIVKGTYDFSGALIGGLVGLFLIFAHKKTSLNTFS